MESYLLSSVAKLTASVEITQKDHTKQMELMMDTAEANKNTCIYILDQQYRANPEEIQTGVYGEKLEYHK